MTAAVSRSNQSAPHSPLAIPPAFNALVTALSLRLRDINSFQLPRLSSGSSSSAAAASTLDRTTFAAYETELNDALDECAQIVAEGDLLARDLHYQVALEANAEQVQAIMRDEWNRVREQLTNSQASARDVLLQARKAVAERRKHPILEDTSGPLASQQKGNTTQTGPKDDQAASAPSKSSRRNATGDDAALLASDDLTSALQNTLSQLSDALGQSALSSQLLEESTSTLSGLSLDYTTFTDLLKNSGGILKSMERQDRVDALMLLGAYFFFALCVGYILKVRLFDRGLGVLMFFLRILGFKSSAKATPEALKMAAEAASKMPSSAIAAGQAVKETSTGIVQAAAAAVTTAVSAGIAAAVGAGTESAASVLEQIKGAYAEPDAVPDVLEQIKEAYQEPGESVVDDLTDDKDSGAAEHSKEDMEEDDQEDEMAEKLSDDAETVAEEHLEDVPQHDELDQKELDDSKDQASVDEPVEMEEDITDPSVEYDDNKSGGEVPPENLDEAEPEVPEPEEEAVDEAREASHEDSEDDHLEEEEPFEYDDEETTPEDDQIGMTHDEL